MITLVDTSNEVIITLPPATGSGIVFVFEINLPRCKLHDTDTIHRLTPGCIITATDPSITTIGKKLLKTLGIYSLIQKIFKKLRPKWKVSVKKGEKSHEYH